MAFQYRRRPDDEMDKRASQQGGGFDSFIKDEYRTFTPKAGENALRILPRDEREQADHYGEDVWVHFGIGPEKGSVICLQKMLNEPCPICEEHARAMRRGDKEEANEFRAVRRVIMWVIDRKNEDQGPLLWAAAWTVDRDIAKQARDRETGRYYYIDDPEQGYDIYFDRSGENVQTKYSGFQLARRPSTVSPKFLDFVEQNPLLDTLRVRSYEELKHIFEGNVDPAAEVIPPARSERDGVRDAEPPRARETRSDDRSNARDDDWSGGRPNGRESELARPQEATDDPRRDSREVMTRPAPVERRELKRPALVSPTNGKARQEPNGASNPLPDPTPTPTVTAAVDGKSRAAALRERFARK